MPYGYYGFYWMDYTYILVVIGAIICLIASARMNSTFNRYQRVRSMSGMTGAMAAERILRDAGIHDVQVQHISGNLTDHYNPMNKTLSLSDSVYNSTSVAAVGVAAHECGHAIQHAKGYVPLRVRGAFVPVANIGSNLAWPLIIIGLFIRGSMSSVLIQTGIIMFSLAVLFQLTFVRFLILGFLWQWLPFNRKDYHLTLQTLLTWLNQWEHSLVQSVQFFSMVPLL